MPVFVRFIGFLTILLSCHHPIEPDILLSSYLTPSAKSRGEQSRDTASKVIPDFNSVINWQERHIDIDNAPDHPVKRFLLKAREQNLPPLVVSGEAVLAWFYGSSLERTLRGIELYPLIPVPFDPSSMTDLNTPVITDLHRKIMQKIASGLGVNNDVYKKTRGLAKAGALHEGVKVYGSNKNESFYRFFISEEKKETGIIFRSMIPITAIGITPQGQVIATDESIQHLQQGIVGWKGNSRIKGKRGPTLQEILLMVGLKNRFQNLQYDRSVPNFIEYELPHIEGFLARNPKRWWLLDEILKQAIDPEQVKKDLIGFGLKILMDLPADQEIETSL